MNKAKFFTLTILITLLLASASHAQFLYFGKNKVNYDNFEWQLFKTPHFDLYFYPEEEKLVNSIVNWLESGYMYIAQKYDWNLTRRIPVFFYKTKSEFEQTSIYPAFLPLGVEAFSEPIRNRFVVPLDQPPLNMQQLIIHEMTHTFQYDILYEFNIPKKFLSRTPLWFIEGMAEHTARGFTTEDEMRVRDIVLHDMVPPINRLGSNQFMAYQLGQTVIDYIVERYKQEGFNQLLLYLRRNGSGPQQLLNAINEVFKVSHQEFSRGWRKWLRKRYINLLVEKEEAEDIAMPLAENSLIRFFSPTISPTGEIIAAYVINNNDVDVFTLSARDGRPIANLTEGHPEEFQYIIGGNITHRFHGGPDIAWSPDSNTIAFFARTGKKRSLFLVDAYTGAVKHKFQMELDQVIQPEFTPDGKAVLFSGIEDGTSRDIYKVTIKTGKVEPVTKDRFFNYSPVASRDGKYVYFFTNLDGYRKIFRVAVDNPQEREQITYGKWNDLFPVLSPNGKKLAYVSDETGIYNVYELNLDNRTRTQYTDVMSGTFNPQYLSDDKLTFSYYRKGGYSLWEMPLDEAVAEKNISPADDKIEPAEFRKLADDWTKWNVGSSYLPPTELSKDKVNTDPQYDFIIENASLNAGMSSDGTLLTLSYLQFSDITSAIKFRVNFATIGSFRNVGMLYLNQRNRLNWGFQLFDYTSYFVQNVNFAGDVNRELAQLIVENIGLNIFGNYPFSLYTRLELSAGFLNRDFDYPQEYEGLEGTNSDYTGFYSQFQSGNFLPITLGLVHDSVLYNYYGPMHGTKYKIQGTHAFGLGEDFGSYSEVRFDYRKYMDISSELVLAVRLVANHSFGDSPNVFFFGGTNTLRGTEYLEQNGNTTFFGNFELRLPLATRIDLPIGVRLSGLRGVVFFDIGGAFFKGDDFNFLADGEFRLEDAVAAWGFGFHFRFIGAEFHFNWSKRTDFVNSDDFKFQFWVGYKF